MASNRKKTVLITGCSPGGIGHALCRAFHAKGLHVIATARDAAVLADLEALGMTTLSLDVTNSESIKAAKQHIQELTGGTLDILVNNAGKNCTVPSTDVDLAEARDVFETNFFAIIAMIQAFVPMLISSKGLIINIGSIAGTMPYVFGSVYNASKAAVHSYSEALRLELQPYGVRVMVVITGGVQSRIARLDRKLPEDSLFLPIKDEYEKRVVHSQQGAMDHDVYAKGVVDKALKRSPPKWLWRGNKTFLVWFGLNYMGKWIFDLVFPRMFGLHKLAAWVKMNAKKRAA